MRSGASVTVVSAGQLATCPRMVKVIDALHERGYRLRAVTNRRVQWASEADRLLLRERPWLDHVQIDNTRASGVASFLPAAMGQRLARLLTARLGVDSWSARVRARALVRSYTGMASAILAAPTDLVYACGASYPVVAAVARLAGLTYAVDFEDFHSGEFEADAVGVDPALTESLELEAASGARFVTMASPGIADAYRQRYGIDGHVIHNVFPMSGVLDLDQASGDDGERSLSLCWFSQTVGAGRGLEEAVTSIGRTGLSMRLAIRGRVNGFRHVLERHAARLAPRLAIDWQPPVAPDELIPACRMFDIGLCLETGLTLNSSALLSNKLFTYLAAGLAIVLSDTSAQRAFHRKLGESQALVNLDDPGDLASVLARWHEDRSALRYAREQSFRHARERWHWEHARERGALCSLFADGLPRVEVGVR